jgi:glyoxylase-like metal-dependent hydrolase (beta-lactamase superfamily II)
MLQTHLLPTASGLEQAGITVFERGWLSSNNILIQGKSGPLALVDSGYVSHAEQTLSLVRSALNGQRLDLLLNTHLHSDHCGGNALLQSSFPALRTLIPPGLAPAVRDWDPVALTYEPTGQSCAPFLFEGLLLPGSTVQLGSLHWQVHAAEGHDPHSIILFQPQYRVLISADALWENGFGVVFPELEGLDAFEEVANTLDLIEQLAPLTVIPGHGSIFQDVPAALSRARSRLSSFVENPAKHKRHALKVLLKFKLLEWQKIHRSTLHHWCQRTPYMVCLATDGASGPLSVEASSAFLDPLLKELECSGALRIEGDVVYNS